MSTDNTPLDVLQFEASVVDDAIHGSVSHPGHQPFEEKARDRAEVLLKQVSDEVTAEARRKKAEGAGEA